MGWIMNTSSEKKLHNVHISLPGDNSQEAQATALQLGQLVENLSEENTQWLLEKLALGDPDKVNGLVQKIRKLTNPFT